MMMMKVWTPRLLVKNLYRSCSISSFSPSFCSVNGLQQFSRLVQRQNAVQDNVGFLQLHLLLLQALPASLQEQLIMFIISGGHGSPLPIYGVGMPSCKLQLKLFKSNWGGPLWLAYFASKTCKCTHFTCNNIFLSVGGRALSFNGFIFFFMYKS